MHHTSGLRRALHVAVASTLALSMGALGLASAQAATITPDSVNPAAHIYDCLGALFSDPAAHQQYCGPGSGGSTPPSTLAPTFSSPAVTCAFTSLQAPLFATFKTASLDDLGPVGFGKHFVSQRVATGYGCCISSLPRPLFSAFEIASINENLSPVDFGQLSTGLRVANTNCCISSLGSTLFSTFNVATLDDALTIPNGALRDVHVLAQSAC